MPKALPSKVIIRRAVARDEKRWREAEGQVPQVAQVIENVAAGIDKASSDLEGALALQIGPASK